MSATACAGMRILIFLLTLAFGIGGLIFAVGAACMAASGVLTLTGILLPLAAILVKVGVAALLGGGAIAFVFAVCVAITLATYFVAGCHQQPAVPANTTMAGFLGPMGGSGLPFPFPFPFPFPGLPFPLPGLPPGIDPAKFLQCLATASAGCSCGGAGGGGEKNSFVDAWNMLQGGIAFLDGKRREAEEKAAQLRSWIEQQAGQAGSNTAKTVEQARQQLSELEKQGQQFGEALNNARAAGGQMLSNAGKSLGFG